MSNDKQVLTSVTVAALVVGTAVAACRDNSLSPPSGDGAAALNQGSPVVRYTPEELHARNPQDWVGRVHNAFVRAVVTEFRKPGTRVTDLCQRMAVWIEESGELQRVAPQMATYGAARMKADLLSSVLCRRSRADALGRLVSMPTVSEDTISTAAMAALEDVEEETAAASDPTDLASRLSPILSNAPSLGFDSLVVQTAVAQAQSSFELWYDGSEQEAMAQSMQNEMSPCLQGQMEDQYYQLGESTYLCQGSEWRLTATRGRRPDAIFRLASNTLAASCMPDGPAVVNADLGAIIAGAITAYLTGAWVANPPTAAAAIVIGSGAVSTVEALGQVWGLVKCFFGLS